jgi:hypothetical protein
MTLVYSTRYIIMIYHTLGTIYLKLYRMLNKRMTKNTRVRICFANTVRECIMMLLVLYHEEYMTGI